MWSADVCTAALQTWVLKGTNGTIYGDTVTIAGKALTFSNVLAATTVLTNTTGSGSTTNLYSQLGRFPILGATGTMTNANTIVFRGEALVISQSGNWCSLTAVTNVGTNVWDYALPIENLAGGPNTWTNNASNLVYSVRYSGSQANAKFGNAWPAFDDFVGTGANFSGGTQRVTAPKFFNRLGGTNEQGIFGGVWWTGFAPSLTTTSAVNYGNAFSSPGTGSASEQFGSGSVASNANAIAIGGTAGGTGSIAIGSGGLNTYALSNASIAIGQTASSEGDHGIAIGANSLVAGGEYSTALGYQAVVGSIGGSAIGAYSTSIYQNSTALGYQSSTSESNQVSIGSSLVAHTRVQGRLSATAGITNATLTGTNKITGDLSAPMHALSTLANGNNLAVPFTNLFVALSGPSAAFCINGIYGGRDGRWIHGVNLSGQTLTLAHESGVDPTPGNRLHLSPAADQTFSDGQHFDLWYNATLSRWLSWKPESSVIVTNAIGTVKTNGTTVSSAATSLDLITPWNALWVFTNAGGVVTAELRVFTNTFDGTQFTLTGTGGSNVVIKSGVSLTNVATYGATVNNGSQSTIGLSTNSGLYNTWLNSSNISITSSSATVVPFGLTAKSSSTTNQFEIRDPSGYPTFFVYSNGLSYCSISNASVFMPLTAVMFRQHAETTVTNFSTSETSWLGSGGGSRTLPANFWVKNRAVRMKGRGHLWTPASPGNSSIRVKVGGTIVGTNMLMSLPTSVNPEIFNFDITLECKTNSASIGYIECFGEMATQNGAASGIGALRGFRSTQTLLDTTASALVDLVSTNGATTISTTVEQCVLYFEPEPYP